jgi:hypothetical protein
LNICPQAKLSPLNLMDLSCERSSHGEARRLADRLIFVIEQQVNKY